MSAVRFSSVSITRPIKLILHQIIFMLMQFQYFTRPLLSWCTVNTFGRVSLMSYSYGYVSSVSSLEYFYIDVVSLLSLDYSKVSLPNYSCYNFSNSWCNFNILSRLLLYWYIVSVSSLDCYYGDVVAVLLLALDPWEGFPLALAPFFLPMHLSVAINSFLNLVPTIQYKRPLMLWLRAAER